MVGGRLTDSTLGFSTSNFKRHATPPQIQRQPCQARQEDEAPMADHLVLRSKGQLLGYVDAIDAKGAEAAAAEQFKLDAFQSRRLLVQELAQ